MADIIRCKDCKHFEAWRTPEAAEKHGQIYECSLLVITNPSPDDYCSKAKPWPIIERTIGDTKVRCPYCNTVWENINIPDAIWNSSSFMCPFCGKCLVKVSEEEESCQESQ